MNSRCAGVCVGAPHSLQVSSGCSHTVVPVMIVRRTRPVVPPPADRPTSSAIRIAPVGHTWLQAPQPMHSSAGRVKSK